MKKNHSSENWPKPLSDIAYYGLLGRAVKGLLPYVEADPAAILTQSIVMLGNILGRKPYIRAGAVEQHLNLNVLVVGKSAHSRKGTSLAHAKEIISPLDPQWTEKCHLSGLSSGEGLIQNVSDNTPTSDFDSYTSSSDKRRMVYETEFAGPLKKAGRPENVLSQVIRDIWDGNPLKVLTRQNPIEAKHSHISIIGHITIYELGHVFNTIEASNGFGNRFLWVVAKRQRDLPLPPHFDRSELNRAIDQLKKNLSNVSPTEEVKLSSDVEGLWSDEYSNLCDETIPGIQGSLTSRGAPQVLRIATILALSDGKVEISLNHLLAALEIWRYCSDSVKFLYPESMEEDEKLLNFIASGSNGRIRMEIHRFFQNNKSKGQLDSILERLRNEGKVTSKSEPRPKGGRATERWILL